MPMDEKYFTWLYEKVRPESNKGLLPYMTVCAIAHRMIFNWAVPNDDNRAAEGKELRYEFEEELGIPRPRDTEWMGLDASVFEMMIALAIRCDFIAGRGVDVWFEIFMQNLGLADCNDVLWRSEDTVREEKTEEILRRFNERSYSWDGKGGLFPLKRTTKDQRTVELWYQMSEFMTENEMY